MIKEHNYNTHHWIDLRNPTEKEIEQIINQYGVSRVAALDLLSPTARQRVRMFDNCVYIVLHFPTLEQKKSKNSIADNKQEIDFIVGKNFLITAHYDDSTSITKFSKNFLENPTNDNQEGFLFHKLIKHLYHSLLLDVDIIKDELHKAENAIFEGEEKRMVIELSKIHRDILRFNNALIPHKEAIHTLQSVMREFLGSEYEYIVQDMSAEYQRVDRRMKINKDLLEELRHTNDSLLSTKQNEAMKGLTMMAFITFPLTLIAAIFSMRTNETPIIGQHHDFIIIVGIMCAVIIACISFFNYKKWL